jgi:hypothetical protein
MNFYGNSLRDIVDLIEDRIIHLKELKTLGFTKRSDVIEYFNITDEIKEIDGEYDREEDDCYYIYLGETDDISLLTNKLKNELDVLYDYIEKNSVDTRGEDYNLYTSVYVEELKKRARKECLQKQLKGLYGRVLDTMTQE